MNNVSKYFTGLAEKNIRNVIVTDPHLQYTYQNCINSCKSLGYAHTLDLQLYDPDVVQTCMRECDAVQQYPHINCPDKTCCKSASGSNDIFYVKCLADNHIPYNFEKETHPVITPVVGQSPAPTSDFTILENTTFLPNATGYSCGDTINGYCLENISLEECVKKCDESQFCDFGYHVQLKPDGKTFCLPLMNLPFRSDFLHKNILDDTIAVSSSSLGQSFNAHVFYRTHCRYDKANIYTLTTNMPLIMSFQDKHLNNMLEFGYKNPVLLTIRVVDDSLSAIENHAIVLFNIYRTSNCIVYDSKNKIFTTLPISSGIIHLVAFDSNRFYHRFQIQHSTNQFFISQNDSITIRLLANTTNFTHWVGVDSQNRFILADSPHTFHIQGQSDDQSINFKDADKYYSDFWQQLDQTSPSNNQTYVWLCISGILLIMIVLLLIAVYKQ